jgi:hypothetical protein
MNHRELFIKNKYEQEGWKALHNGAPDFLFLKVKDSQIEDIMAIEVKSKVDKLTYAQKVWRDVLKKANIKYVLEVVE